MAPTLTTTRIQLKRDTAANWTSNNPILAQGEPGLETDTGYMKIGDSSTAWNALAYLPQGLAPTAVKTSGYTAKAGDYVTCNVTSAGFTVTLPTAPADKTRVGVKIVANASTPNTLTIARGGTDVFNVAAGSTTLALTAKFMGVMLQYQASTGIWYVQSLDSATGNPGGAASLGTDGKHKSTEIPTSVVTGSRLIGVSKFKAFGHSYVFGTGGAPNGYGFVDMLGNALHAHRRGRNFGLAGAVLAWDNATTAAQGYGGWVRVGKYIPAQQPGGPFPSFGQLYALMYGLNEIGAYAADAAGLLKFQHALRYAIVRCIASDIRDVNNGSWASTGWSGSAASTETPDAVNFTGTNAKTITFTVPSGYTGNDLWIVCMGYNGNGGSVSFTVDGSAYATLNVGAVAAAGYTKANQWVAAMQKFTGLAAGAHTIVGTTATPGNYVGVTNASIVADAPGPIVLLVLPPQVPAAAGAGYSYPYDLATTITNTKIQTLRTAMIALAAEFPNNVVTVDADAALGLNASYFNADNVHPNPQGHALIAQAAADALSNSPLLTEDWLMLTSQRDRDPIAQPYYGTSITPDMREADSHTVTVTNGTAFTINTPINFADLGNELQTEDLTITIFNGSGGAMGAITWGAGYKFAGLTWTNPANGKSRMARFKFDGFNYVCTYVSSADY